MISGIDYIMQLEQECDKQREYVKEEKEKVKELKNRIDKAIEWVINIQQDKDNKYLEPYIATDTLDELLEILGDKDEKRV